MKVLVFGRTGQVARALAETRPRGVTAEFLDRVDADLARPENLRELVVQRRPDLVINAAAYTAVDLAESERGLAMRVNGEAPGLIAEACKDIGAPLIHYSTDYVFSGAGSKPWRETDPVQPISAYGESKAEGERRVRASLAKALILRTSWVYSSEGKNFVRTMLRLGLEREQLRIVSDQVGAPTSAFEIARATWRIAAGLSGFSDWGVFHLCAKGETTWHGLALATFEEASQLGWPLKVKSVDAIRSDEFPAVARRPLNSRLDTTRLKAVFGIELPDWRVSLGECIGRIDRMGLFQ